MFLLKFHSILISNKLISIIIIIVIAFLFFLFIHQQYGSMIGYMASERAINQLIFTLFEKEKIPDNINLNVKDNLPKFVEKIHDQEVIKIRQYSVYCKIFVPFIKIFKRDITTVEVEEAVIYNLLLIITIIFIISLFINIPSDSV